VHGAYRFDGAISVRHVPHLTRLFNLEVAFDHHHPHIKKFRVRGPSECFIISGWSISDADGELYVDVEAQRSLFTPTNNELQTSV
jgi:hypothetical protein